MNNRIGQLINSDTQSKWLIPFFTAGYPKLNALGELVKMAEDSGCDMVEIGMPFSDPMADGPEIQFSSHTALQNGISLKLIFGQIEKIRKSSHLPLIMMGYYNPVHAFGYQKFLKTARSAGADGFIIPDLPLDEATDFRQECQKNDLSLTFLASPTSDKERLKKIDQMSTDFVYAVTVTGVTGGGKKYTNSTDYYLKGLKKELKHKFVAGFGVSDVISARRLTRFADGVVIGSALVRILKEAKNKKTGYDKLARFLKQIKGALK